MPKGPQGQKRPADALTRAVHVMRIATGQEQETATQTSTAAEMGKKGGHARAEKLSAKRRSEIAKKAAQTRYGQKP